MDTKCCKYWFRIKKDARDGIAICIVKLIKLISHTTFREAYDHLTTKNGDIIVMFKNRLTVQEEEDLEDIIDFLRMVCYNKSA